MTCYYVRTIDEKLLEAVDILTDMFCHSVFPETEISKERGVILEEISMTLDTPDDLLMETLTQEFFQGYGAFAEHIGPSRKHPAL